MLEFVIDPGHPCLPGHFPGRPVVPGVVVLDRVVEAIEQGYPQREIAESAYRFQQSLESGERIVVGVNGFVAEEEPPVGILYIDESAGDRQLAKLEELRKRRDNRRVEGALEALRHGASGSANTMPLLLEAGAAVARDDQLAVFFHAEEQITGSRNRGVRRLASLRGPQRLPRLHVDAEVLAGIARGDSEEHIACDDRIAQSHGHLGILPGGLDHPLRPLLADAIGGCWRPVTAGHDQ